MRWSYSLNSAYSHTTRFTIMEKSLKRQIVDAAEAVKKKVRKMKDMEIDNKQALDSVFRPVTEPLNLIASKQKIKKYEYQNPEISMNSLNESDLDSCSSYESVVENDPGNNTSTWSVSSEALSPIPFGVRVEQGKMRLGSASITINDENIVVAERKYKKTPGLMELLLKKKPNLSLVTESDKQQYKSMLLDTNAHRRDYTASKPIKSNKGLKYLQVIKPLFRITDNLLGEQPKGEGLPLTKMWHKDVDIRYWDDPNELVERLKLLTASREAGNTGLDGEIISIIEELRESKIINK